MSKVMEYVSYFFNDIATVPRLSVALSVAFAVVVALLIIGNFAFGAMAKVRKVSAKTKKFFKKYDSIDYYNIRIFYKKCMSKLPQRARKSWRSFELCGKPIQNTQFELVLRESVAKGGAIGFGFYLYLYIAVMAVLVVSMMVSSIPQEISSIYVCVCLIVGAVGLFVLGMQLYIMDKRSVKRLDSLVCLIYTKNKVYKEQPKNTEIASVVSMPIVNAPQEIAKLSQPMYGHLDRINQAISQPIDQCREIGVVTLATAQEVSHDDCIDKLNTLVDAIVRQGGNAELIESVRKALLAVYDVKFSKPIDELRIKCIIKKLDAVS